MHESRWLTVKRVACDLTAPFLQVPEAGETPENVLLGISHKKTRLTLGAAGFFMTRI
ncbi:hypothetical protein [Acetobacter oeni]|uniref:Uncharacterized protein n=1 Tax=Acetobacter oeni TaxID=304077 RepID=A0A511XJ38_9PROT|nr:hypothetical protein [Acetobacter oeni]MBB3882707.1 hypothetical protein [Acetobacter oeni]NHO18809.1 hypothetical protein [Acetobacter oeni]GEN62960.1 hypothetical protein AOE01nite_11840 [Acetobacter oeni]